MPISDYIPIRHYEIRTALSPQRVYGLLLAQIGESNIGDIAMNNYPDKPFIGEVSKTSIKVNWITNIGAKRLGHFIKGTITASKDGTVIDVTIRPSILRCILWLSPIIITLFTLPNSLVVFVILALPLFAVHAAMINVYDKVVLESIELIKEITQANALEER